MLSVKEVERIYFTDKTDEIEEILKLSRNGLHTDGSEAAIATIFTFNDDNIYDSWMRLNEIIHSYVNREGLSTYIEAGITFPQEAEEWENQQGIVFYSPISRVEMSEEAFDYLARKYFRAVYSVAVTHKDSYLETPEGKQFAQFVKDLPEN